jgi:hypothetical protein
MRHFQKNPKTFRAHQYLWERGQLRKRALDVEIDSLSQVNCLKTEPLEFFRQVLEVEPTDYQKELIELFQKNQFAAARWSRQHKKK